MVYTFQTRRIAACSYGGLQRARGWAVVREWRNAGTTEYLHTHARGAVRLCLWSDQADAAHQAGRQVAVTGSRLGVVYVSLADDVPVEVVC